MENEDLLTEIQALSDDIMDYADNIDAVNNKAEQEQNRVNIICAAEEIIKAARKLEFND